jgi:hypothetical protein
MLSGRWSSIRKQMLTLRDAVAVDNWVQLLLSLTRGGVVSSPGVSSRKFNHDFDSVCH